MCGQLRIIAYAQIKIPLNEKKYIFECRTRMSCIRNEQRKEDTITILRILNTVLNFGQFFFFFVLFRIFFEVVFLKVHLTLYVC